MVTNLDAQRQLVPHHRAASVTSRASTSRRHRQSRSQHGTGSSHTQNAFPYFGQTGDVEISLTTSNDRREQRYLLHSLILSQGSGVFEDDLRVDTAGALTAGSAGPQAIHQPRPVYPDNTMNVNSSFDAVATRQSPPVQRRWRYVLDWGNTDDQDVPMLVMRQPTHSEEATAPPVSMASKPPASSSAFFRSVANLSALTTTGQATAPWTDPDDEILRDYDNLFRVLYNYPPAIDAVNIANAYTEAKALLHLAEMYDALDIVGGRIDYHLLQFGNRLFKQIAKYPSSYLKLGYLARSKTIFAEALIHVVGQWPLARTQIENQTDSAVLDLIEDKVDMLDELKARVEGKLFRLSLTTTRGERVMPSVSFLDWLAMSLFRQWLADNTTPEAIAPMIKSTAQNTTNHTNDTRALVAVPTRSSSRRDLPGARRDSMQTTQPATAAPSTHPALTAAAQTGRTYRLLGSPDREAYLNQDELKRFLKHAPEGMYTRENLRRLARRMDELKAMARDVVRPLCKNELELDLVAAGFGGDGRAGAEGRGGGARVALGYLTCTRVGRADFPWQD